MELEASDWLRIKNDAEGLLKDALINAAVYKNTIEMAESEFKKRPEKEKKRASDLFEIKKASK